MREEKTEVHVGYGQCHTSHSFILIHSANADEKLLYARKCSGSWGHSGHEDRHHLCLVGSHFLVGETENATRQLIKIIQVEKQIIMGP